ncbi:hypothetical protein BROC_00071 [Candidatus Brocadiaceae bacterium]|nr:hypothetical protein BROC_00071 [Candidatus Brocadiaceae bacterium]
MKIHSIITIFTSFLLMIGCSSTVDISAINKSKVPLEVKAFTYDSDNVKEDSFDLGRVQPEKSVSGKAKVKHGGRIEVKAYLPDSAETDEASRTITSDDPDPFFFNIELSNNLRLLDEDAAINLLGKAFGNLGSNVGYQPKKIDTALNNDLGSLIVFVPPEEGQLAAPPLFSLGPGIFGPKVKKEEIFWPANHIDKKVQVTGSKSASLAVSAAVYGSLGIDTSSSDLFELEMKMSGFGIVQGQSWDYVEALGELTPAHRAAIQSALDSNPNSKLLYIDRMYVIQDAVFRRRKATKIAGTTKLSAASIVTASGAWNFEQDYEDAGRFYESVVNVGGIEIPRNALKSKLSSVNKPVTVWPVHTVIPLSR